MKYLASALLLLGSLTVPGLAQDYDDEPNHGVARLSLISGDVTVRRGDSGEDIAAEPNAPLVARDHVFTDRSARAEIQLDWANIIRLAPDGEVRMATLADRNYRVELAEGTLTLRVLRDSNAEVEISTPTASIRPKKQGTYRITVRDDFSTEITVRSGDTDVLVGRDYSPVRSGQTLIVRGDPANPERNFVSFAPRDEWDSWNESRDRDLERSDSYKYVSRDIYGADDLYGHGRWIYDPPYGWVWAPTVAANWAPYRNGRWYYADYYGWTWLSADPWGWAPYHYGSWYHAPRYGWVWYPGPIGPRHYWRPALVSFFGWGVGIGSVSVSFGWGNVGWVPLAPYEVYRPWYGRHVNVISVVNNVNVVNVYRNTRYVNGYNGVTSVVAGDFGRRRVNVNNFVVANDRDLSRVGDVRGRVPFEPSRDARRLSDRQAVVRNDGRRGNNNDNRQFVASRPETPRQDNDRVRQNPQPRPADLQSVRQEPRNERPRDNDRVFVSQPNNTRQAAQPGQQDRRAVQQSEPRNNDRAFVTRPDSPRQAVQPGQPTFQAGQPGRPDRSSRPDGLNAAGRIAVPEVPARREEPRVRQPDFVAAPSPTPTNRIFDRGITNPERIQRESPQANRQAPAVQERRQPSSQPASGNSNNSNRSQGRGRR